MAHRELLPKNAIACARASIMLRYLPYSGRAPYASKRMSGRYEECFATKGDALDRLRELRREHRIEDAEIVREVRDSRGGRGLRTELEWLDRRARRRARG
jgi:hypothetical protein